MKMDNVSIETSKFQKNNITRKVNLQNTEFFHLKNY